MWMVSWQRWLRAFVKKIQCQAGGRSSCDLSNTVNESTKQGIITVIIMLLLVLLICLHTPFLPDTSSLEPTVILTAQTSRFSLLHFPALCCCCCCCFMLLHPLTNVLPPGAPLRQIWFVEILVITLTCGIDFQRYFYQLWNASDVTFTVLLLCLHIALFLMMMMMIIIIIIIIVRMWNVNAKVIPVRVGANGTISKSFRPEQNIGKARNELRKTAIFGTVYILQKVLM